MDFDDASPEQLAFMVLGQYARVQSGMDSFTWSHIAKPAPDVAAVEVADVLRPRLERATDQERIALAAAAARDRGLDEVFANVPGVFGRVKKFRDMVGHGWIVSGADEGDDMVLQVQPSYGDIETFRKRELVGLLADVQWIDDVLAYMMDRSGFLAKNLVREDGTGVIEVPPPVVAPRRPHTNYYIAQW